jgi:hypothetical protein
LYFGPKWLQKNCCCTGKNWREKKSLTFPFPSLPATFKIVARSFLRRCECQNSVTDHAVSRNTARGVHILLTNKIKGAILYKTVQWKILYWNYQYLYKQQQMHNAFILNELR